MNQLEHGFHAARYWPQLDGLRTLSIIIVFLSHMGDPAIWGFLNGSMGVTLFFVISGFLITSLLLREERRDGRVSLKNFYIRRAFRIAPMYYLALTMTIVLVTVFHLGTGSATFMERLPLIATFNGEFAGSGTFSHSWSLGIEEKFYILWPLLAFALPLRIRTRLTVATALLAFACIAAYVDGTRIIGYYTAILAGCTLALLMDGSRGLRLVQPLAKPAVSVVMALIAVGAYILDPLLPGATASGHSHVVFSFAVALAFPGIILPGGWPQKVFAWKPLVYIGTRTYGLYLFHPFCIDVVGKAIPDAQHNPVLAMTRFVLAFLVSFAVAEVLYRLVEGPCIKLGRRLTHNLTSPRSIERDPIIVTTGS